MTERELIVSLKNGSDDAFTALYHTYWQKVYRFSRLYITSPDEVEEIVQEVFVKLWEVRALIKEDESFKGFLFIVTRNTIFNQMRKSFNETAYKLTVANSANPNYEIEGEMVAQDLKIHLQKIIAELPPRQQEVFRLSREQHLSYKEIAIQLEITEKTVERHINEALKVLRRNVMMYVIFLGM